MEVFLAVMQYSSVTRAAEKLFLSPGAVSLQLHNLAAEFLGEAKPWTTAPEVARISCPECAEKIMPTAKICIHCHSKLDGKGNLATK